MVGFAISIGGTLACVTALASGAVAQPASQTGRYELFPEQSVRRASNHWTASAYIVDKGANQFWICTARYGFDSQEGNNGDCTVLPPGTGRPSLSERHKAEAVLGATTLQGPYYPVLWFIEPASGDVQFCAPRHPGVCLKLNLP